MLAGFVQQNLCLARSGDASWAGTGRLGAAIGVIVGELAVKEGIDVWHLGLGERTSGFAACWALAVFLVGCNVEGDEEEEVGCDYAHSCKSSEFLASAVTRIWHPLEVGRGKIGV